MNINSNVLLLSNDWHHVGWKVQITQRSYETTTSSISWPNSSCFVFSTLSQPSSWFLRVQADDVWGSLARDSSHGDARALGSLLLWRGRCLTLLAFGRPLGLSVNPLECSCADTVSRCLRERQREREKLGDREGAFLLPKRGSQTWISEDVKGFNLCVWCFSIRCHQSLTVVILNHRAFTHASTVLLLLMTNQRKWSISD